MTINCKVCEFSAAIPSLKYNNRTHTHTRARIHWFHIGQLIQATEQMISIPLNSIRHFIYWICNIRPLDKLDIIHYISAGVECAWRTRKNKKSSSKLKLNRNIYVVVLARFFCILIDAFLCKKTTTQYLHRLEYSSITHLKYWIVCCGRAQCLCILPGAVAVIVFWNPAVTDI